ncbi:MAG: biotin carboxylase N-terminal domain-containing protein, partial [Balneolaceae bacterium]
TAADAIHPGYGFLSENAEFARKCIDEGLIFIGPPPESIDLMGDKTAARKLMARANVPFPPGTQNHLETIEEAGKAAEQIGFPVLVKAAAGGGGKGMRIIEDRENFTSGIKAARSEARNAFGDDRIYIEKYFNSPKHIEIQIISDAHGNVCHLFERECSIQRRHQKVIEEAPSTVLDQEMRSRMAESAIKAAEACNYIGAGTVEFLVDREMNYYFIEMNTRLQVEHPVTELITGYDLVELQIRVARGEELPFQQDDIKISGHAIECRIYAEDPEENFLPAVGRLARHRPPAGPWIRVDAGVEEGQEISIHYDPMISKLCVHAPDRAMAVSRMLRALAEYEIAGCRTTIPFCSYVMRHPDFADGNYNTAFVRDKYQPDKLYSEAGDEPDIVAIAAAFVSENDPEEKSVRDNSAKPSGTEPDNWWNNRR